MTKEDGIIKKESYELESSDTTSRNVDLYIGQNFVTNSDRLHKILNENLDRVNIKPTNWELPFSISVTLVIALISAEFVDRFGIPKFVWITFTVIGLGFSLFWLYRALKRYLSMRKRKLSIDELIKIIESKPTGKIKDF
jgi:hypothetical protein